MPRTPCCCNNCTSCSTNANSQLQASITASNDKCDGDPGCDVMDGDWVLTGPTRDYNPQYVPPILPFDPELVCHWTGNTDVAPCSPDACENCTCSTVMLCEGDPCEPGVLECSDLLSVNESAECADCPNAIPCTYNCEGGGNCDCVSDGMGGYVCQTTATTCNCDYTCGDPPGGAGAIINVWRYLSMDETEIVTYVEVESRGEVWTGHMTQAAVSGKAACDGPYTINLTSQNPGTQTMCTLGATITLEWL